MDMKSEGRVQSLQKCISRDGSSDRQVMRMRDRKVETETVDVSETTYKEGASDLACFYETRCLGGAHRMSVVG